MCMALGPVDKNKYDETEWLFECFHNGPGCVGEFEACLHQVRRGNIKSCGCHKRLKIKETHTTHGMTGTPEYHSYVNMHQRCYNPNNPAYKYYGGKGIKVEWEWYKDNPDGFKNFIEYMGRITDSDKNTIERFNNNLTYGTKNVKKGWQDRKTQARNQSKNIIDDMVEAELIRDLYKLGHSIIIIARAVAATKGRSCSWSTIYNCIKNISWTK